MAIEWNRNGVLDWTFQVMRATDRGKIEKNRKKKFSFSTTCCYKFSISPNVDTVLESPRSSASNGGTMSAANLNGGGSRGRYLAIFWRFFSIPLSVKPLLHIGDTTVGTSGSHGWTHNWMGYPTPRSQLPAFINKKVVGQKPPEKCIFDGFSIFSRSSVDLEGF